MNRLFPHIVDYKGTRVRYTGTLKKLVNGGDEDLIESFLRHVVLHENVGTPEPEQVRMHSRMVVGLNNHQSAWVTRIFTRLLADRHVATVLLQRNPSTTIRDAMRTARAARFATSIETLQVGPRSVVLLEFDPEEGHQTEIPYAAKSLQRELNCKVIAKASNINVRALSIQELHALKKEVDDAVEHLT